MGIKIEATPEEMQAFEECLKHFHDEVAERCPKFRMIGMFIGIPNEDGVYGCMIALGKNVTYEGFAKVTSEMGTWMTHFGIQ